MWEGSPVSRRWRPESLFGAYDLFSASYSYGEETSHNEKQKIGGEARNPENSDLTESGGELLQRIRAEASLGDLC